MLNRLSILNSSLDTMAFDLYNYVIIELNGIGDMTNYLASFESPYIDGTQVFGRKAEPKHITLKMWVRAATREALLAKRIEFLDFFSPKKTSILFWYDTYYLDVEHENVQELGGEYAGYLEQGFLVSFFAPYPFWYGKTQNLKMFTLEQGGFELPLIYPFSLETTGINAEVLNEGNMVTPVTWQLKGKMIYPGLYNTSTGNKLEFDVELEAGDILDVETATKNRHATITRADGTIENAFSYRTSGSTLWWLEKGTNNINVKAYDKSGAAYAKMWWKNWVTGV